MVRYREKPVLFNVVRFDEFIESGKRQEGANVVDGVPIFFTFSGYSVVRLASGSYLLTLGHTAHVMDPEDVLIINAFGYIQTENQRAFANRYEPVDANQGVLDAAEAVISADRSQTLTDDHINALENAIAIQRGLIKLPDAKDNDG